MENGSILEDRRRNEDSWLRVVLDVGKIGAWSVDLETQEVSWSDSLYELFGLEPNSLELTIDSAIDMWHPDDRARFDDLIALAGSGYLNDFELTARFVRADGEIRWVGVRGRVERGEGGAAQRLVGAAIDITETKRSELRLAETLQRLDFHAERSPIAVIEWDEGFRVKRWSKRAAEIFGWSEEDVLGKHPFEWEFVHPEDREMVAASISALASGQSPQVSITNRCLTKEGEERWGNWHTTALLDEQGKLASVMSLVQDITDQRRAEEQYKRSEDRLRRFIDAGIVGIIHWQSGGQITEANDAFLSLLGYSKQDLRKGLLNWKDLTPPEWASKTESGLKRVLEKGRANPYEKEYFRKDGSRVPVLVGGVAYDAANGEGISFVVDLSEHHRLEQELRELNAELEERVNDRTEQLKAANRELEAFCYSVSHDLRGPLRSIMGSSMILVEDYGDKLDGDAKEDLARIDRSAKHMAQLIEDILQLSRVQRAEVNRQDIDLAAVANDVASELAGRGGKTPEFVVHGPLPASADPRLIRIVLMNLIENAFKFSGSKEGARVEVGRREDGAFFIRDNGIGFDQKYADKIFEPFERLTRDYPGSGVGLSTVKRIVEKHEGRIWAEGEVGQGASFYFTLGDR